MHKASLYTIIGCVVAAALLTVIQMWTFALPWDVFLKILGTLGILIVLLGFLLVVGIDFGDHKRLKDENYLD